MTRRMLFVPSNVFSFALRLSLANRLISSANLMHIYPQGKRLPHFLHHRRFWRRPRSSNSLLRLSRSVFWSRWDLLLEERREDHPVSQLMSLRSSQKRTMVSSATCSNERRDASKKRTNLDRNVPSSSIPLHRLGFHLAVLLEGHGMHRARFHSEVGAFEFEEVHDLREKTARGARSVRRGRK